MTAIATLVRMLKSEQVTFRKLVDGTGVLLVVPSGHVLSLNESAMLLVEQLADGVQDIEELVERTVAEFEVDCETARRDIVACVDGLARELGVTPLDQE